MTDFGNAFRAARNTGKGIFTFNNKVYNTRYKGENEEEFKAKFKDYSDYINGINSPSSNAPSNAVKIVTNDTEIPPEKEIPSFSSEIVNEPRLIGYNKVNTSTVKPRNTRVNSPKTWSSEVVLKKQVVPRKTVASFFGFKNGGQINMDELLLLLAFIQFLAQKTGAKTYEELEAVILQLGEEGLKQAYAEFIQLMQELLVLSAKFGAKLNYIKQLRGKCPEGYEIEYFQQGGQLCKKCKKKQIMEKGGKTPDNPIDSFKLRQKTKKKETKENINPDDTIHINNKVYDLSGKHSKYPKLNYKKYQSLSNYDKVRVDEKDLSRGRDVNTPN